MKTIYILKKKRLLKSQNIGCYDNLIKALKGAHESKEKRIRIYETRVNNEGETVFSEEIARIEK